MTGGGDPPLPPPRPPYPTWRGRPYRREGTTRPPWSSRVPRSPPNLSHRTRFPRAPPSSKHHRQFVPPSSSNTFHDPPSSLPRSLQGRIRSPQRTPPRHSDHREYPYRGEPGPSYRAEHFEGSSFPARSIHAKAGEPPSSHRSTDHPAPYRGEPGPLYRADTLHLREDHEPRRPTADTYASRVDSGPNYGPWFRPAPKIHKPLKPRKRRLPAHALGPFRASLNLPTESPVLSRLGTNSTERATGILRDAAPLSSQTRERASYHSIISRKPPVDGPPKYSKKPYSGPSLSTRGERFKRPPIPLGELKSSAAVQRGLSKFPSRASSSIRSSLQGNKQLSNTSIHKPSSGSKSSQETRRDQKQNDISRDSPTFKQESQQELNSHNNLAISSKRHSENEASVILKFQNSNNSGNELRAQNEKRNENDFVETEEVERISHRMINEDNMRLKEDMSVDNANKQDSPQENVTEQETGDRKSPAKRLRSPKDLAEGVSIGARNEIPSLQKDDEKRNIDKEGSLPPTDRSPEEWSVPRSSGKDDNSEIQNQTDHAESSNRDNVRTLDPGVKSQQSEIIESLSFEHIANLKSAIRKTNLSGKQLEQSQSNPEVKQQGKRSKHDITNITSLDVKEAHGKDELSKEQDIKAEVERVGPVKHEKILDSSQQTVSLQVSNSANQLGTAATTEKHIPTEQETVIAKKDTDYVLPKERPDTSVLRSSSTKGGVVTEREELETNANEKRKTDDSVKTPGKASPTSSDTARLNRPRTDSEFTKLEEADAGKISSQEQLPKTLLNQQPEISANRSNTVERIKSSQDEANANMKDGQSKLDSAVHDSEEGTSEMDIETPTVNSKQSQGSHEPMLLEEEEVMITDDLVSREDQLNDEPDENAGSVEFDEEPKEKDTEDKSIEGLGQTTKEAKEKPDSVSNDMNGKPVIEIQPPKKASVSRVATRSSRKKAISERAEVVQGHIPVNPVSNDAHPTTSPPKLSIPAPVSVPASALALMRSSPRPRTRRPNHSKLTSLSTFAGPSSPMLPSPIHLSVADPSPQNSERNKLLKQIHDVDNQISLSERKISNLRSLRAQSAEAISGLESAVRQIASTIESELLPASILEDRVNQELAIEKPLYQTNPLISSLRKTLIQNQCKAAAAAALLRPFCSDPEGGLIPSLASLSDLSSPSTECIEAIREELRKRKHARHVKNRKLAKEYFHLRRQWLKKLKIARDKRSKEKREAMRDRDRFLLLATQGQSALNSSRTSSGRTSTKVIPLATMNGQGNTSAELDSRLAEIEAAGGTPGLKKVWGKTLAEVPDQDASAVPKDIACRRVDDPIADYHSFRALNPWTFAEKVIFLEKFVSFPKNFHRISSFLEHKSTRDCVHFYFSNKLGIGLKQLLKESSTMKRKGTLRSHIIELAKKPITFYALDEANGTLDESGDEPENEFNNGDKRRTHESDPKNGSYLDPPLPFQKLSERIRSECKDINLEGFNIRDFKIAISVHGFDWKAISSHLAITGKTSSDYRVFYRSHWQSLVDEEPRANDSLDSKSKISGDVSTDLGQKAGASPKSSTSPRIDMKAALTNPASSQRTSKGSKLLMSPRPSKHSKPVGSPKIGRSSKKSSSPKVNSHGKKARSPEPGHSPESHRMSSEITLPPRAVSSSRNDSGQKQGLKSSALSNQSVLENSGKANFDVDGTTESELDTDTGKAISQRSQDLLQDGDKNLANGEPKLSSPIASKTRSARASKAGSNRQSDKDTQTGRGKQSCSHGKGTNPDETAKSVQSTKRSRPTATWTPEEGERFKQLFKQHGREWKKISQLMHPKTPTQIKGYWRKIASELRAENNTTKVDSGGSKKEKNNSSKGNDKGDAQKAKKGDSSKRQDDNDRRECTDINAETEEQKDRKMNLVDIEEAKLQRTSEDGWETKQGKEKVRKVFENSSPADGVEQEGQIPPELVEPLVRRSTMTLPSLELRNLTTGFISQPRSAHAFHENNATGEVGAGRLPLLRSRRIEPWRPNGLRSVPVTGSTKESPDLSSVPVPAVGAATRQSEKTQATNEGGGSRENRSVLELLGSRLRDPNNSQTKDSSRK